MKYWSSMFGVVLLSFMLLTCPEITTCSVNATSPIHTPTSTPSASHQNTAHTLYQQAHQLRLNGQIYSALNKYDQALLLYQHAGDRYGEAQVLVDLGSLHYELDHYPESFELLKQARRIQYEIGDQRGQIETLIVLSQLYETMGQSDVASTCYQQALDLYQTLEATTVFSSTETVNDQIESSYAQALAYYQQILTLRQEMGDRRGEGRARMKLGWIYHSTLQYADAMRYYQQSLAIAQEVGDRLAEVQVLDYIGRVYASMNQESRAMQHFQQALIVIHQTEVRGAKDKILSHIGNLYLRQGEYDKALQCYQDALHLMYEENSGEMIEGSIFNDIGYCHLLLKNYDLARSFFYRQIKHSEFYVEREAIAIALYHLGQLHFEQGQHGKALDFLQQAQQAYQGITKREGGEINVLVMMARIYEQRGDLQTALTYYRKAIAIQEDIRTAAKLEEFKLSIAENPTALKAYNRAIQIHVTLGQETEAFELTERARARVFLDQLGNARLDYHRDADAQLVEEEQALLNHITTLERDLQWELARSSRDTMQIQSLNAQIDDLRQQYADLLARIKLSNPQYTSLISSDPLTLARIQDLLDDQSTLLSYFVTPEETLVFVVTSTALDVITLPVSAKDLTIAIQDFRNFANLEHLPIVNLMQLYDWLILPILPHLKTHQVGIIPHNILHYMPFAALTDGEIYFGDQRTLFYLPSASVLPFIYQNRRPGETPQVLALAQSHIPGVPPLPYTQQEVQAIAELYPTTLLTGAIATESNLASRAGEHAILHVATHGQLEANNPLFSAISLTPDVHTDGRLEVREVYKLDLHSTELVVLSACQTKMGEHSLGDDIIGLNRAFIYAGAPTVIASLWTVEDRATALLMTRFYTHLRSGESKAVALQKAQTDIRAEYPHPYYWAAFVLTGDAGKTMAVRSSPGSNLNNPLALLLLLILSLCSIGIAKWHRRAQSND